MMPGSAPKNTILSSWGFPVRYDTRSPEFWIFSAALYGLVVACFLPSGLSWTIQHKRSPRRQQALREAVLILLVAATATQFGVGLARLSSPNPVPHFDVCSTLTALLSYIATSYTQRMQCSQRQRRRDTPVVLLFWASMQLALSFELWILVQSKIYSKDLPYFAAFCVSYSLSGTELVLGCAGKTNHVGHHSTNSSATLLSRLTFSWLTPLMRRGCKYPLAESDLSDLPTELSASSTGHAFSNAWADTDKFQHAGPALIVALLKAYSKSYAMGGVLKIVTDVCGFLQPWLLGHFLEFVERYDPKTDTPPESWAYGVGIVTGMFLLAVMQAMTAHQYQQMVLKTSIEVKGGLTAEVYRKVLRLSNESLFSQGSGDLVNHMAVDMMSLQALVQNGHRLWSSPFQIIIGAALLYNFVGWPLLAGLAVMIATVVSSAVLSTAVERLKSALTRARDVRIRLISEMIENIRTVKLYAWIQPFVERLDCSRQDQELRILRRLGVLHSAAGLNWKSVPFFMSCGTFAFFVLLENQVLSAEIIFPVFLLSSMLVSPMIFLSTALKLTCQGLSASNRIGAFLRKSEVQRDAVIFKERIFRAGDRAVIIRNGDFSRQFDDCGNTLSDINFSARRGQLSSITGRVGSGKSSLLQAMLGELRRTRGEVIIRGSIAYVSQNVWLSSSSVRENIVFGQPFDPNRYQQTIAACALEDDFAQLSLGDHTVIGKCGMTVSGGQKARISLARAVYSQADIYLLDDCLSAVDAHVGQHLMQHVLGPYGLLQSKTRVLATNWSPAFVLSNQVVVLENGKIAERGPPAELLSRTDSKVAKLIAQTEISRSQTCIRSSSNSVTDVDSDATPDQAHGFGHHLGDMDMIRASSISRKGMQGGYNPQPVDALSPGIPDEIGQEADVPPESRNTEMGLRERTKWEVYSRYLKTIGPSAGIIFVIILVGSQAAQLASIIWLKIWAESEKQTGDSTNNHFYVGVYFALGLGSGLVALVQNLLIRTVYSNKASQKLHARLAKAVFGSPMSFFDVTPAARIICMFKEDMRSVDEDLGCMVNLVLTDTARTLAALAGIAYAAPPLIALLVPLVALGVWIQAHSSPASRSLRRHESATLGPVHKHLKDCLGGIATIRAFRQQGRFQAEHLRRVDAHLRARHPSGSADSWRGLRADLVGALAVLSSAGFCVLSAALWGGGAGGGAGAAARAGLAVTCALQATASLRGLARHAVDAQPSVAALGRVLRYCELEPEGADRNAAAAHQPEAAWPAAGAVRLHQYSTRYRAGLDLVLRYVSVDIAPRERVGIVGRTGAGKSSLALALFRILEPATGTLRIDKVDTTTVSLDDLRQRLAIVPQDSALFEGTLRQNLDLQNDCSDTRIWSVIQAVGLDDLVQYRGVGLDLKIYERGSNLSHGQRQLVSLARVMLKPSKLLVLDEATSSADAATDAQIQAVLRGPSFKDHTIIAVAHRIDTVLDYDRIIVLDKGSVVELGAPADLIRKRGLFYNLAKEAGALKE